MIGSRRIDLVVRDRGSSFFGGELACADGGWNDSLSVIRATAHGQINQLRGRMLIHNGEKGGFGIFPQNERQGAGVFAEMIDGDFPRAEGK